MSASWFVHAIYLIMIAYNLVNGNNLAAFLLTATWFGWTFAVWSRDTKEYKNTVKTVDKILPNFGILGTPVYLASIYAVYYFSSKSLRNQTISGKSFVVKFLSAFASQRQFAAFIGLFMFHSWDGRRITLLALEAALVTFIASSFK